MELVTINVLMTPLSCYQIKKITEIAKATTMLFSKGIYEDGYFNKVSYLRQSKAMPNYIHNYFRKSKTKQSKFCGKYV